MTLKNRSKTRKRKTIQRKNKAKKNQMKKKSRTNLAKIDRGIFKLMSFQLFCVIVN